jgi:hypothetical protein
MLSTTATCGPLDSARALEVKGQGANQFLFFIQVKLAKDGTQWPYIGGENIAEFAPISCELDIVVEEALFALFGIET